MTSFTDQHRELLFDYSLGLTSESETVEAERLLAQSQEAVGLYDTLRSVLSPLDALEVEPCPEELAARTVLRLKEVSQAALQPDRAEELLPVGQIGLSTIRIPFWRNWGDIAAVAAVLVLTVGVLLPTLSFARQQYWQSRCQTNLGAVQEGMVRYAGDHDGQFPSVPMDAGAPWWKVSYQGPENYSNTRRGYKLVREGYVSLDKFLCPARRIEGEVSFENLKVEDYSDFPERSFISFSIRIGCPQSRETNSGTRRVLMADQNPLAERLPADYSAEFRLRVDEEFLRANSRNHGGRGQNVAFSDGSIQFLRQRHTSLSEDDIFTPAEITDGCEMRGYERPCSEKDAFVAP
ncbi:MAG: hypothetical protein RBS72_01885 [Sedimentisphaerales bacterium]|jgi:hypothetical protein|nr:hypothetical protein [Sedimentisphaerales bacterium]HNY77199.1 hypothetical protein [Sedimentisphaerales bacterium]HOC62385.1 hypothetical protein [Sedimentisphaerales bacterium]HOH66594.1 hypothetical protein [Sedimentisphaerales bacterium]HQN32704.1 hypothetical protein [Sedimentisphaerales bacterium]